MRLLVAVATAAESRQLARSAAGLRIVQTGPALRAANFDDAIRERPCGVVAFGFAAGLDEALDRGTVLLPRRVLDPDGEATAVHEEWRCHVGRSLAARATCDGDLLTVNEVVCSASAKRDLRRQTGATAVDMESARVAAIASHHRLPFIAVRVVLDRADEDLPGAATRMVSHSGRTSAAWTVIALLTRPIACARLLLAYTGAARSLRAAGAALCPPPRDGGAGRTAGHGQAVPAE